MSIKVYEAGEEKQIQEIFTCQDLGINQISAVMASPSVFPQVKTFYFKCFSMVLVRNCLQPLVTETRDQCFKCLWDMEIYFFLR